MAHSLRAIYSARLAIFIHGITSARRTREARPAVLVRESSTQFVMDTCVRYSTYIRIFKSQKGSIEALAELSRNYLIDYLRDYTIGFIIHYLITTEK